MLRLDDSIFEYALYDVLHALRASAGTPIGLDELRSEWRMTGLRHTDLYVALDLLATAESLAPVGEMVWSLTEAGADRVREVAGVSTATMADHVARSVLKLIQERVPAGVRTSARNRRSGMARVRVRTSGRLGVF
jgi:hypothetical protein